MWIDAVISCMVALSFLALASTVLGLQLIVISYYAGNGAGESGFCGSVQAIVV